MKVTNKKEENGFFFLFTLVGSY